MELSPYFNGVIKAFYSCPDATEQAMSPKLAALIESLQQHRVPSNELILYSASNQLWPDMTFDQHGVVYACQHGKLGFLQWLNTWQELDREYMFLVASRANQLEICQWVNSTELVNVPYDIFTEVIANRAVDTFEYLTVMYPDIYQDQVIDCFTHAVKAGSYQIAKMISEKNIIPTENIYSLFAEVCDSKLFVSATWLYNRYSYLDEQIGRMLITMVRENEVEVVSWLLSIWCNINYNLVYSAMVYARDKKYHPLAKILYNVVRRE